MTAMRYDILKSHCIPFYRITSAASEPSDQLTRRRSRVTRKAEPNIELVFSYVVCAPSAPEIGRIILGTQRVADQLILHWVSHRLFRQSQRPGIRHVLQIEGSQLAEGTVLTVYMQHREWPCQKTSVRTLRGV